MYEHLFQGRYKALNVDDDDHYFETVSTYIHLNPVRAGLVSAKPGALAGFWWSSFPEYLTPLRKRPPWLEVARVLGSLGIGRDDAFKTRLLDWIEERACKAFDSSDRAAKWAHDERTADKRVTVGLKAVGLVKKDLDKFPKGAPEKLVLAWWLKGSPTVSRQWISAHLAMGHPTRVTSAGRDVQGGNGGPVAKMRGHLEKLEM